MTPSAVLFLWLTDWYRVPLAMPVLCQPSRMLVLTVAHDGQLATPVTFAPRQSSQPATAKAFRSPSQQRLALDEFAS